MPKIGNRKYETPGRDIDDCVQFLQEAWEKARKYNFSREEFAEAISQSASSGSFHSLLGAMAMYGLIETGGGDVKFTELGKSALFGKDAEQENAKKQALRKVKLFADLVERFGSEMTDDNIRVFLRSDAGVDIGELDEQAKGVKLMLKRNSQYVTATKPQQESQGVTRVDRTPDVSFDLGGSKAIVSTSFGQIKVTDDATLEIARKYLEVVEKQLAKSGTIGNNVQGT